MARPLPDTLSRLLRAEGSEEQDAAWEAFVQEHSRLVHLAARRSASGYDDVMDRYAFVLESLRRDEFKRLRAFAADGRSRFSTWLVVVSSRLCVDYHRTRYGRYAPSEGDKHQAQERRRLVDLVGEKIDLGALPDRSGQAPDRRLEEQELRTALEASLLELEADERLLVRLRFEDEVPVRQIARLLGLSSEFAAHRRLKAVLAKLAEGLRRRGIDRG